MKLVQDTKCPHCKKEFEIESDLDKIDIKPPTKAQAGASTTLEPLTVEMPKEVIKEKIVAPSHIPAYKCKDGNCGQVHKNPNYFNKVKARCENCGQFTDDINSPCIWCNEKDFEELDEDEFENLGIPQPNEANHHGHE